MSDLVVSSRSLLYDLYADLPGIPKSLDKLDVRRLLKLTRMFSSREEG